MAVEKKSPVPSVESHSILVNAKMASKLLGIGRTLFLTMNQTGRLGPMGVKLGRRRLWRRKELIDWTSAGCPPREKWTTMKENNINVELRGGYGKKIKGFVAL